MEGQCYGGIMVPAIACQVFIPPTESQKEQFDTEACSTVLQQKKTKYFFLQHIFFNIYLFFSPLLIYWHVSQSQEKILCMKLYIQYSMSSDVLPSPWSCMAALKFLLRRQQLPTTTLSSVNTGTFKELCQLKKNPTQNNVCCRSSQKYRHFSSARAGEASGLSEPFLWPTLQEFCHFKSL